MSLYVTMQLDRPRRFQFGFFDLETVCDHLNASRTLKEEVDGIGKVLQLLGRMHPPTWGIVLQTGLSHQDKDLKTPERAKKLLKGYLEHGGSMEPLQEAIIEAIRASGLISKDVYDQVKARRDGGREADSEGEEPGEEPAADPSQAPETSR